MQIDNGGSEQPSCSNVGLTPLALRKILREEFEPIVLSTVRSLMKPMVIATLQQEIKPLFEGLLGLFRGVVKEEIQKHLSGGSRNELAKERSLQLRFLDEVRGPVQTGKLIGKNDGCLKLGLVDANGDIVCESRAKVEIVLLSDNGNDDDDDDDGNMSVENFERRIIRTGDKEKPHFAKSVYINLEKGVGSLSNLKLGHGEKWTKLWKCRLGAKMAENLPRTIVQEAWTEAFKVIDKRVEHYKKDASPSPNSKVWRLKKIGRGGDPCKRLSDNNITTVQDFRFWLSVNPTGLRQQILGAGESRWNTIITHAKGCIINDEKMYYSHNSWTTPLTRVIYDAVGQLKGVIHDSHFIPFANLSADEKIDAQKLLMSVLEPSAFLQRYQTFFNDQDALLQQFPTRCSSTSLNASENIHASQSICDVTRPSGSLESTHTPTPPGSLFSPSSTMTSFGENGGSTSRTRSGTDHMAITCGGSDAQHNGPDFLEDFMNQFPSTSSIDTHLTQPCLSPQSIIPAWPCSPNLYENWIIELNGHEETQTVDRTPVCLSKWFSVRRRVASDVVAHNRTKKQKLG